MTIVVAFNVLFKCFLKDQLQGNVDKREKALSVKISYSKYGNSKC